MKSPSPEKVMETFVAYICANKADSRHVRRVAAWLGFVVYGVDRMADKWGFHRTRQFWFESGGVTYKVRFRHGSGMKKSCLRGGLQIVRVDGVADGPVVLEIRNAAEAEDFYRTSLAHRPAFKVAA